MDSPHAPPSIYSDHFTSATNAADRKWEQLQHLPPQNIFTNSDLLTRSRVKHDMNNDSLDQWRNPPQAPYLKPVDYLETMRDLAESILHYPAPQHVKSIPSQRASEILEWMAEN
jgi:hypothetical protein